MANVRDVVQTVIDGLDVFKGILPDGNWQQVAAHLAAPGQQQILQQQQQILEQQQQMQQQLTQQQQQMQQQLHQAMQPVAQMQVTLQQMQVTMQQVQQDVQQVQQDVQQVQQDVQQVQQDVQQVQQDVQQVQRDLASMRWTQVNAAIRFHNKKSRDAIRPLHKEREGGNNPVGALPPAPLRFPQNLSEAAALTVNELNQLQDFYQFQFPGHLVGDRRLAFSAYISEPAEM
jgi:predicted RNase H-like nuclease (RuvC/YqgF family)